MEHGKKKIVTRSISFILVFVLILSFFVGVVFADLIDSKQGVCGPGYTVGNCEIEFIGRVEIDGSKQEISGYRWERRTITGSCEKKGSKFGCTQLGCTCVIEAGNTICYASCTQYRKVNMKGEVIDYECWYVEKCKCNVTGEYEKGEPYISGQVRETKVTEWVNFWDLLFGTGWHSFQNPPKDPVYLTPSVEAFGYVAPATPSVHKVFIDLTISDAIFIMQWFNNNSYLNLVLYSPNGTRIDSSVAVNNSSIFYVEDSECKFYVIEKPESGIWTIEISAIEVPSDAEMYAVSVRPEGTLTFSLSTDKEYCNLEEQINITGRLVLEGAPLIGASVTAEITRPDDTVDTLSLFDDGSHGDDQANDGNYSNIYENIIVEGLYSIIARASGTTPTGDDFTRGDGLVVQTPSSEFTGYYTDYGIDTDGDGLYNYLIIELGVNAVVEGVYHIQGILYDLNENEITWTLNDLQLHTGYQIVKLNFTGRDIRAHCASGSYSLKSLALFAEKGNMLEYISDAYNTSTYGYTDFQAPLAEFTGGYADYGIDFDGDGLYEYLTVDVGVNVIITAGNYTVDGYLYDANGNEIVWSIDYGILDVGNHIMHLDFDGETIQTHGVNGPYYLKHLMLSSGENWIFIDYIPEAYTTSAYSYSDFGSPYWTIVEIDIKPGSDPNSINLKSKGVVPVAALSNGDFDASTVDTSTVVFAGAEPVKWTMEDVDGDGDIDMLFHFKIQELNLDENSTEATLTGDTSDGKHIKGTDSVNIVPKGKSNGL